ncbi:Transcription factor ETV6 [Schistosoma japonicum]|nr:Transcription factor ETV6 [Schistosoma japonicum]
MEIPSWSSDFKEQSRCNDSDRNVDHLPSERYKKLTSTYTPINCDYIQPTFALPNSQNASFCLPNQINSMNSIFPYRQVITCSCRCCNPSSDNLSYITNQLFDNNIDFPSFSLNDSNFDVGNGDDEQPKLNLTDPLMTDIAVGELDNSPNLRHEYDMLLMLPSSSISSTSSIGCINNHCNSMSSSPAEIEFFNPSTSLYTTNCNNSSNTFRNSISPIECFSSSSSSPSNGSCCSFKSQQCYNCINSLQVRDLNSADDNVSSNSAAVTSTLTNTDTTVVVPTSTSLTKLFKRSNSPIYHQNQQHMPTSSMKPNRPVWQMKFTRKQYVYNRAVVINNDSSFTPMIRSRQQHHQHYHNQQQLHHYYHQSKRRVPSTSKKSSSVNNHLDSTYNTLPTSMHYTYLPNSAILQLPSRTITSVQEQTMQCPIRDLSTYTFQLSPSVPNNQSDRLVYSDNTASTTMTTKSTNNNNHMDSVVNVLEDKEDSFVCTVPMKKGRNESPSSFPTITTATTINITNGTNSVTCRNQSRNYPISHPISTSNLVHKRLHLLQFIIKLLQYSSDSSSLAISTNASVSAFISSLFPTSTSTTSMCSINNQPNESTQHLFHPCSQFLNCVQWIDKQAHIFQIRNPQKLSQLWGYYRKNGNMTFESVSRSLR